MSDTIRIDGRAVARDVLAEVARETAMLTGRGHKPGLAVVLVGEDAASAVYVRNKGRETVAAGMESFTHRLPASTPEAELLALLARLNADDTVDGILVQLPLPPTIDSGRVLAAIDPDKDVDGFHVVNVGRLSVGGAGNGAVHAQRLRAAADAGAGATFRASTRWWLGGRTLWASRWRSCCCSKTAR